MSALSLPPLLLSLTHFYLYPPSERTHLLKLELLFLVQPRLTLNFNPTSASQMLELQVCSAGGGTRGSHGRYDHCQLSHIPSPYFSALLEIEMHLPEYLVILYLGFLLVLLFVFCFKQNTLVTSFSFVKV